MPGRPSFRDQILAEQAQAAGTAICGFTCACHGDLVCIRPPHDNHGDHWLRPDGSTVAAGSDVSPGPDWVWQPENRVVHAAIVNGAPVTWSGPHVSPAYQTFLDSEAVSDRRDATRAWLASIDRETFLTWLHAGE